MPIGKKTMCIVSKKNRIKIGYVSWPKVDPISGLEVIKLFLSSAQLSMKFQLLINAEIVKISGKFKFKTQKLVIYPSHKC